ncbi:tetratricopeptide domain-containing protein [Oscillochloris trichoides DG-6]|uniref:Tetratricopeptide domain-containing protein n=1 Tax=Oscillochloris trichoides DG-6 TaxID=765420 RepID=E1IG45_9CHLR|nr:hypothetical protein [Oscillochloris trichoides]EFO79843.1 tetratricopeptide domain-containing protein [Oscillochloris trichoides DG-6]
MSIDLQAYLGYIHTHAQSGARVSLGQTILSPLFASMSPAQTELLRRCAIPRWFDASVLRVLREHEQGNEALLAELRQLSCVHELGDGRLAFLPEVRSLLLKEWEQQRHDELIQIHRRLYSYFSNRTTPPGSTRRAMSLLPESSLLSVIPISLQSDLFQREALYHLIHADPLRGIDELRAIFNTLARNHRLVDAELLLQAVDSGLLNSLQQRWIQYMRARIEQNSLNLHGATQQYEALRSMPDLDPELRAETNRALAEVYAEMGQWGRSIRLYKQSLDYFMRTNNQRASADTMVLLGEAYQGLGLRMGSWHLPTASSYGQRVGLWLIGLPFQILSLLLGSQERLLPLPSYCAHYQNWFLIRFFNTARDWFIQARKLYQRMQDEGGMLRAEQRVIDILRSYGYHEEARSKIEALIKRPPARDPYWRAWLDRSLAECYLAVNNPLRAQEILSNARAVFREFGDIRREAAILVLQGQTAMQVGDHSVALALMAAGLRHYRDLGYATARERILHELRMWKNQPATPEEVRSQIATLIAAEPEKRYAQRFTRSYLPLLQVIGLITIPLGLLLMAMSVPITHSIHLGAGVLASTIRYDPLHIVGVLLLLVLLLTPSHTTIASILIFGLPISRMEREQPDMICTTPEAIICYDHMGQAKQQMAWRDVRGWRILDRCSWERPLPLSSGVVLEDANGQQLQIPGVTNWYAELQRDIGERLAAVGNPCRSTDLTYRLLKSWSGLSLSVGLLMILLVGLTENWSLGLPLWFPANLYALITSITLSGAAILVPLAYWLVNRPLSLQRSLLHEEIWPKMLFILGILPVMLYAISWGSAIPVGMLNASTFVWGIYTLTEATLARFPATRTQLRMPGALLASLLASILVWQPIQADYQWQTSLIARNQIAAALVKGEMPPSSTFAHCQAVVHAQALGYDPLRGYMLQGDCAGLSGNWREAINAYRAALYHTPANPGEQALSLYNLWNATYQENREEADEVREQFNTLCHTSKRAATVCQQVASYMQR